MKNIFSFLLTLAVVNVHAQSVGINTSAPDSSAQLDVSSVTKGFLPPRMTYQQRNQIAAPAAGLTVWCTDCDTSGQMQVFNGSSWTNMIGSAAAKPIPPFLIICGQTWMKKNLDVSRYRNGDIIPEVEDAVQWQTLTTGAWCWYNNDSANYASVYGKLYNWYAVNDPRGLAPQGWHIPADSDFHNLANSCLGGNGGSLKAADTLYWNGPNTGATNNSGFRALGAGYRNFGGAFVNLKQIGIWWSSTEDLSAPGTARDMALSYSSASVLFGNSGKTLGFSVRCIKD